MERFKKIFNSIVDDKSKDIFINRLLFSITEDRRYVIKIIKSLTVGAEFANILNQTSKRYLFGAGVWGGELFDIWQNHIDGKTWSGFIDNNLNKANTLFKGLKIYSIDELPSDAYIFVSTRLYYKEICRQLQQQGFDKKRIINVGKMIDDMARVQYFDVADLESCEEEVFVDVGAFDGMTSLRFMEYCNYNYKLIYCFEPDKSNIKKCYDTLNQRTSKFEIIPKAAWDSETKISFNEKGTGSSSVTKKDESNCVIETITMDDALKDNNVSFIKMDVEGSEYKAILGARRIISTQKPKLAISIYHKPEDIIEIPYLILEMNPDYRLYFRHYSLTSSETVMYAI